MGAEAEGAGGGEGDDVIEHRDAATVDGEHVRLGVLDTHLMTSHHNVVWLMT